MQHIFEGIKHSLGRLQLDYVDVIQCHRFDANTPIEETMQALHDVVRAGHARYIGMSSCYAWQCEFHPHIKFLIIDAERSPVDAESVQLIINLDFDD